LDCFPIHECTAALYSTQYLNQSREEDAKGAAGAKKDF
jgi:hypothetical protein